MDLALHGLNHRLMGGRKGGLPVAQATIQATQVMRLVEREVWMDFSRRLRAFWDLPGSEQSRLLDAVATTLALHVCDGRKRPDVSECTGNDDCGCRGCWYLSGFADTQSVASESGK